MMFGFTRKESGVLLFLISTFTIGMGIQIYRRHWAQLPVTINEEQASNFTTSVEPVHQNTALQTFDTENPIYISLNHATKTELEKLPGVGPVTAKRIIAYRMQNGSFHSIKDLTKVKGVGEKTLQKIEPYIKLN
jgi:comEA protein